VALIHGDSGVDHTKLDVDGMMFHSAHGPTFSRGLDGANVRGLATAAAITTAGKRTSTSQNIRFQQQQTCITEARRSSHEHVVAIVHRSKARISSRLAMYGRSRGGP
jgi:hypothetical protein